MGWFKLGFDDALLIEKVSITVDVIFQIGNFLSHKIYCSHTFCIRNFTCVSGCHINFRCALYYARIHVSDNTDVYSHAQGLLASSGVGPAIGAQPM